MRIHRVYIVKVFLSSPSGPGYLIVAVGKQIIEEKRVITYYWTDFRQASIVDSDELYYLHSWSSEIIPEAFKTTIKTGILTTEKIT